MMLDGGFPVAQYDLMREALLQHVSHLEGRLGGAEKTVQLAQLLDQLENIPSGKQVVGNRWLAGDVLHHILIDAIKRHTGRIAFADDVITMLTATQAYEIFRGW